MTTLSLQGDLSYKSVKEIRKTFLIKCKQSTQLLLSIEDMGKLDCAGLQLIYSLGKWLLSGGGNLVLAPSEATNRINALARKIGMNEFQVGE